MKRTALSAALISILSTLLFISNAAAAVQFSDVPTKHWANSDIQTLARQGVLNGYSDGSFKPGQNVTRDQAAKIISLAAGIEPLHPKQATYPDVPPSHWAFGYIEGLSAAGVISGKNNGFFAPKEPLTRGQMAKILKESFGLEANTGNHFRDVPESAWMFEYVMALRDNGITLGYPEDNSFRPYGNVTRAQMAAFANRTMTWEMELEIEPLPDDLKQEFAEELHKQINSARATNGNHYPLHGPVQSKYGSDRAKEMFFHEDPDGFSPDWNVTKENLSAGGGWPVRIAAESTAIGSIGVDGIKDIVDGWVNDPLHRSNIVSSWDNVEFGIYGDIKTGKIVYTAVFITYENVSGGEYPN